MGVFWGWGSMGGDLKKFLEHKTSHFYSIISPEKMKHLSLQTKIFLFWPDGPLNEDINILLTLMTGNISVKIGLNLNFIS